MFQFFIYNTIIALTWLPVRHVQVQRERYAERDQSRNPVDQEHSHYADERSEQGHPSVVELQQSMTSARSGSEQTSIGLKGSLSPRGNDLYGGRGHAGS